MSKTLRIEPVPGNSLVQIAWEGGGEVPDQLKGMFTTHAVAQAHIAAWRAANPERDVPEARVVLRDEGRRGPGRPPKNQFESLK